VFAPLEHTRALAAGFAIKKDGASYSHKVELSSLAKESQYRLQHSAVLHCSPWHSAVAGLGCKSAALWVWWLLQRLVEPNAKAQSPRQQAVEKLSNNGTRLAVVLKSPFSVEW
jgi:hypothetical protein